MICFLGLASLSLISWRWPQPTARTLPVLGENATSAKQDAVLFLIADLPVRASHTNTVPSIPHDTKRRSSLLHFKDCTWTVRTGNWGNWYLLTVFNKVQWLKKILNLWPKCLWNTIYTDLLIMTSQVQFFLCSDVINVDHFSNDGGELVAIVIEQTL